MYIYISINCLQIVGPMFHPHNMIMLHFTRKMKIDLDFRNEWKNYTFLKCFLNIQFGINLKLLGFLKELILNQSFNYIKFEAFWRENTAFGLFGLFEILLLLISRFTSGSNICYTLLNQPIAWILCFILLTLSWYCIGIKDNTVNSLYSNDQIDSVLAPWIVSNLKMSPIVL